MRTLKQSELEKLKISSDDNMLLLGNKLIMAVNNSMAALTNSIQKLSVGGDNKDVVRELVATREALKEATKPQSWEFDVKRNNKGFIKKVTATPK